MSGLQSFDLDELDKLAEQAQPYHEFLRRRGMSLGIYVLPAGGTDSQTRYLEAKPKTSSLPRSICHL